MSPALTATVWDSTLKFFVDNDPDPTVAILAATLRDIVNTVDDPRVVEILNTYALYMMRQA